MALFIASILPSSKVRLVQIKMAKGSGLRLPDEFRIFELCDVKFMPEDPHKL